MALTSIQTVLIKILANNKRNQKNPGTKTRDIAECLEGRQHPVVKVAKDKPNSSRSNDTMDNYCKEIKRRLEGYENAPSIKRLRVSKSLMNGLR